MISLRRIEHSAQVSLGSVMEDANVRAIEPLPFKTNTPYAVDDWHVNGGIEVVSVTGRFYTIVVTAIKANHVEGTISIVGRKWRLRKEEQRNVTLRSEDGMIVVDSQT
jgi:hypothetical protein